MKVLAINSGSSSIKYRLFNMEDRSILTYGLLEKIGEATSRLKYHWVNVYGKHESVQEGRVADHAEGLKLILDYILKLGIVQDLHELAGIGHRVVHGGETLWQPTLITDDVVEAIREISPLAPLQNPANLMGIEVSRKLCPSVPQVVVFDTGFHHTMPPHAYRYAIPHDYYEQHKVRRYGFHGTSHGYVAKQASRYLGRKPNTCNFVTLHLGNGASACCIKEGKCVDTSMGMTPLEGLMMGTRCGDLDPAIPFYLTRRTGIPFDEFDAILNKQSGLKGICGVNDMREVERLAMEGDAAAGLALDMFCYRIRKYIGSYYAVLGRLDAVIFTGGIGENSITVRKKCCEGLSNLGIEFDEKKNQYCSEDIHDITADTSNVHVLVVPTNEELEIAQQTAECIKVTKKQ